MKNVKQLSLLMLISIFVFSASVANAQKGNCNGAGTANYNQQGIENKIPDLTDKQKEDIKALRIKNAKESQEIKDQMGIKRAELKALQNAENPNLDAINKKIEERAALRTSLEKKTAAHRQAVRNLLTDDQKVIFDKRASHKGGKTYNCGRKPGKSCGGKGHSGCKK